MNPKFWPNLILWLAALAGAVPAAGAAGFQDSRQPDDLSARIGMLDHVEYALRQKATDELAGGGVSSLPDLAAAYFSGTTEQRWRILKILQAISLSGDQTDFYRAAATLRLLAGPQFSREDVTGLLARWQAGQSDRALRHLRESNVKFEQRLDRFGNPVFPGVWGNQGNAVIVQGPQIVILGPGGQVPVPANGPMIDEPAAARPPPESDSEEPDSAWDTASVGEKLQVIQSLVTAPPETTRPIAMSQQVSRGDPARGAGGAAGNTAADDPDLGYEGALTLLEQRLLLNGPQDIGETGSAGEMSTQTAVLDEDWKADPQDLANLAAVVGLQSVSIRSLPDFSAAEIRSLANIPGLLSLSVTGTPLDSEAVAALAEFQQLQSLELDPGEIDPAWIDAAAKLPNLNQLSLKSAATVTADFRQFQRFLSLRMLTLGNIELSAEDFHELQRLPFLSELELVRCRFQLADCLEFRELARSVRVTAQGPAFLGVRGSSMGINDVGCVISEVVPGSAAELAGLEAGDLVRRIENIRISAFDDLILIVSQKQPGDTIRVDVDREGQSLVCKPVLGDRANAPLR